MYALLAGSLASYGSPSCCAFPRRAPGHWRDRKDDLVRYLVECVTSIQNNTAGIYTSLVASENFSEITEDTSYIFKANYAVTRCTPPLKLSEKNGSKII